jgi:hypothetical protein
MSTAKRTVAIHAAAIVSGGIAGALIEAPNDRTVLGIVVGAFLVETASLTILAMVNARKERRAL